MDVDGQFNNNIDVVHPVQLKQGEAARLALQTREYFDNSIYAKLYHATLHKISDTYPERDEQIQAELKLQCVLMQQHETRVEFVVNRDLLMQKFNYLKKGLLLGDEDAITGISDIQIEQDTFNIKEQSFWTKWRSMVAPPNEEQQLQLASIAAAMAYKI